MKPASQRSSAHRLIMILAAVVGATLLTVFGALFGVRFSDNFDVIEPGVAYRSGQLWPNELLAVVQQRGIRSIISLSPPEPDQPWYQAELAITNAQHIERHEMPLSSRDELTSEELCQLLKLMKTVPKPVLIHSRNGADLAGLAAAMFRYALASRPAEVAKDQLSIRYGHFPFLVSGTGAMDASFQKFLKEQARAAES